MGVRLGLLSTFPPTQCGIATFCQALVSQLRLTGVDAGVVRLVDELHPVVEPVVAQWLAGSGDRGADAAAAALDSFDVAVVQHEYGIYGGPDGEDVLDVVSRLHVPVISVLHTVLTQPTANQHRVLSMLVERSSAVVTMTRTARDRLVAGWDVDPSIVSVIAHGAVDNRSPRVVRSATPTVLSWGLLSPGKGIEWALTAMAMLRDRMPMPTYLVAGQTHPRVRERDGDAYRDGLVALVRDLRLTDCVRFDSRYLDAAELRRVVRSADVVLLPYDSPEQVTSGVLTEAVAAGKPVISTAFPHAVELLSDGAGVLVPRRDPVAIADALERVLTTQGLAASMAATSQRLAETLLWPSIAEQYVRLADSLRTHPVGQAV